jgi:hypothetical protein
VWTTFAKDIQHSFKISMGVQPVADKIMMLTTLAPAILFVLVVFALVYLVVRIREEQAKYALLDEKYNDAMTQAMTAEGELRLKEEAYTAIKNVISSFSSKPVMAMLNEEQLMFLSQNIVKGLATQSKSILN